MRYNRESVTQLTTIPRKVLPFQVNGSSAPSNQFRFQSIFKYPDDPRSTLLDHLSAYVFRKRAYDCSIFIVPFGPIATKINQDKTGLFLRLPIITGVAITPRLKSPDFLLDHKGYIIICCKMGQRNCVCPSRNGHYWMWAGLIEYWNSPFHDLNGFHALSALQIVYVQSFHYFCVIYKTSMSNEIFTISVKIVIQRLLLEATITSW